MAGFQPRRETGEVSGNLELPWSLLGHASKQGLARRKMPEPWCN